jgi:hypothetical protein
MIFHAICDASLRLASGKASYSVCSFTPATVRAITRAAGIRAFFESAIYTPKSKFLRDCQWHGPASPVYSSSPAAVGQNAATDSVWTWTAIDADTKLLQASWSARATRRRRTPSCALWRTACPIACNAAVDEVVVGLIFAAGVAAVEPVVAVAADQLIVADPTEDCVVAILAVQLIGAGAAVETIVATATVEVAPGQDVGADRSDRRAARSDKIFSTLTIVSPSLLVPVSRLTLG